MSGGRLGTALAIAGLGLASAAVGCGAAFTSAAPDGGPIAAGAMPDGATSQVAVVVDAAVDAGAGWCATQTAAHTFCEDFLQSVPDKLDGISANAILEPDTTDFESAPQSMAAITPKLPNKGDSATALGTRSFPDATGTQFTLATYFKIASSCFPASGQTDPVSIAILEFPDDNYGIAIAVAPNAVALVEVTTGPDGGITGSPQITPVATPDNLFDSWQLWTLTVDGGIGKSVTLTVGGTTLTPTRTVLKNSQSLVLQHPTILLGATVKNDQGLSPGCKVNVDDILFDAKAAATPAN